jgi:CRISPR-associated protein Csb2
MWALPPVTIMGRNGPPPPRRLFQALVAGAAAIHVSNGELPEVIVSIFRWLERQDLPIIYAPAIRRSSMHVASVPNNDDDITMQNWINGKVAREIEADRKSRYTMKVTPRRLVNGKILYIWDIADSDVEIAREVVRLAELLHCLGRGIDAAWGSGSVGESVSNKGLPRWAPLKEFSIGGERLRVPMPGSIDSLIERQRARYARMWTREFVSLRPRYQEVAYTFDGTVESRPYFLYQVRTLDGRKLFPWRQHNAVTLAAMVRHALDDLHKTSDSDLRSFVMGHVAGERYKSNRLSWVPLPSIGHVHADRRIRRVIAVPTRLLCNFRIS